MDGYEKETRTKARIKREFTIAMDMARYENKPQYVGNFRITYIEYVGQYYAVYNDVGIRFDKVRYDAEDKVLWFCIKTPRKMISVARIPYRVDEHEEDKSSGMDV